MKRVLSSRFIAISAVCAALMLLATLVLALTVLTTQTGLTWAAQWLSAATGKALHIKQPLGSLWNGFYTQQIRFQNAQVEVNADDVAIAIDLKKLLRGWLDLRQLHVSQLNVKTAPSNDPMVLPAALRLPVAVRIQQAMVRNLVVNNISLEQLSLAGQYESNTYRIDRLSVQGSAAASGVSLTVSGVLQDRFPYPLNAKATARGNTRQSSWDASLTATGTLQTPQFDIQGNPQAAQPVRLSGVLTPFATLRTATGVKAFDRPALPFKTLHVQASQFDPHAWLESLPTARLNVSMHVQPSDNPRDSIAGTFDIQNSAPTTLDLHGMPLQTLQGSLQVDGSLQQAEWLKGVVTIDKAVLIRGQVHGRVQWTRQRIISELNLMDIDPSALHALAQPMRLSGSMALQADLAAPSQHLTARLTESDKTPALARQLVIDAEHRDALLAIRALTLTDQGAHASVTGSVQTAGAMHTQLKGSVSAINPARFVRVPNGQFNATVSWVGQLKPSWSGELSVALDRSTWANQDFTGNAHARLQGSPWRIYDMQTALNLAGNTLTASGGYGRPADQLALLVKAPRLAVLGQLIGQPLQGAMTLSASTQGVLPAVTGDLSLIAEGLQVPSVVQVQSARGQLHLGAQATAPWQGDLVVKGVQLFNEQRARVPLISATLSGTRNRHELALTLQTAYKPFGRRNAELGVTAKASGAWSTEQSSWTGQLNQMQISGLWEPIKTASLQSPMSIQWAHHTLNAGPAHWVTAAESVLQLDSLSVSATRLATRGRLKELYLPRLSPILGEPSTIEPKRLTLDAEWSVLMDPAHLNGDINLMYHGGDLELLEDKQVLAGLKAFNMRLLLNDQQAQFSLNATSQIMGQVRADLALPIRAPIRADSRGWTVARNAPMQGHVAAHFDNLGWLGPLADANLRTDGSADIDVAIAGTAQQPQATGSLTSKGLEIALIDEGVRLSDGDIRIDFDDTQAVLTRATFIAGNRQAPRDRIRELGPLISYSGQISAGGRWRIDGTGGAVNVDLKGLGLLQRSDRWMMVSGQLRLAQPTSTGQPLEVTGQLKADGAYIELPKVSVQTLDDDVTVQGSSSPGTGSAASSSQSPLVMDVVADLGDQFFFAGNGLQSRLSGAIRLRLDNIAGGEKKDNMSQRVRATGTIRTEGGTFDAYGQQLSIERGILNFQGPMDNPGINVLAVRKGLSVEAGVDVTGTAKRPRIKLVSEPAVPDSEKLSWLILGQSSDRVNAKDSTLLLRAASALLGGQGLSDAGITKQLSKALGIDDVGISTGSLTGADNKTIGSRVAVAPGSSGNTALSGTDDPLLNQRIISVGKRLSDSVYLAYDQSITTAASVVKLTYQVTRQLSLIGRAGADNAVDFLYQLSFD